jgi:hypothetical protein
MIDGDLIQLVMQDARSIQIFFHPQTKRQQSERKCLRDLHKLTHNKIM